MKNIALATLFLVMLTKPHVNAGEVSTAGLAAFLEISSWDTHVESQGNSYSVNICSIIDGKLQEGIFKDAIIWSQQSRGRLQILIGPQNGVYKVCLSGGNREYVAGLTETSVFNGLVIRRKLPEAVKDGTYVLFGELLDESGLATENEIAGLKKGFALRIETK